MSLLGPCFPVLEKVYVSVSDHGIYLVYRIHFTWQKNKNHETISNWFYPEQKVKKSFVLCHLCPEHEVIAGIMIQVAQKKKNHRIFQTGVEPMTSVVTSPDALPLSHRTLVGAIAEFCLIISEYWKTITISVISENLSPIYQKVSEKFSLKNPKIYEECMSSLTFYHSTNSQFLIAGISFVIDCKELKLFWETKLFVGPSC